MAELLFWCCLVLVLQTYLLYPLAVAVLKKKSPKAAATPSVAAPVVTLWLR